MKYYSDDEEKSRCIILIKSRLGGIASFEEGLGERAVNTLYKDHPSYIKDNGKITGQIEVNGTIKKTADAFIMKIEDAPLRPEIKDLLLQKINN